MTDEDALFEHNRRPLSFHTQRGLSIFLLPLTIAFALPGCVTDLMILRDSFSQSRKADWISPTALFHNLLSFPPDPTAAALCFKFQLCAPAMASGAKCTLERLI